jgi:predicted transcriptional regulator
VSGNPSPAVPSVASLPQQAFVLQRLADAPARRLTRGEVNKKCSVQPAKRIGLGDKSALDGLVAYLANAGFIRAGKQGRSVVIELTEMGQAHLQTLEPVPARVTGRGEFKPPSSDAVASGRRSFLLLQMFLAPQQRLAQNEANRKLGTLGTKYLDLNAATAQALRQQLAAEGLLTITKTGRQEVCSLTTAGVLALGALPIYEAGEFRLTGKQLNGLLEAARDAALQFQNPAPVASPPPAESGPTTLGQMIFDQLEELRRDKYHRTGLVPLFEVRRRVRERFGEESARHSVFDEAMQELRRRGRVRLLPISDAGMASSEELQDSIPGVGETLFYAEFAHEHAVL